MPDVACIDRQVMNGALTAINEVLRRSHFFHYNINKRLLVGRTAKLSPVDVHHGWHTTTLDLDACCARYITMCVTQHTSYNARSLTWVLNGNTLYRLADVI